MRTTSRIMTALTISFAVAGCGASPTAPAPVAPPPATMSSLSGPWAGSVSAPGATYAQVLLLVQTSDSTFAGTFQTTVNGAVVGAGRILTGIVRGTRVTFVEKYTFGTGEPETLFEGVLSQSGATLSSTNAASDWSWTFARK